MQYLYKCNARIPIPAAYPTHLSAVISSKTQTRKHVGKYLKASQTSTMDFLQKWTAYEIFCQRGNLSFAVFFKKRNKNCQESIVLKLLKIYCKYF